MDRVIKIADERQIARTIEDLPVLKEKHARLVHLTNLNNAEEIVENGLVYENQGMVSSVARVWSKRNAHMIRYDTDDPRFSGEHIRAVVLDVHYWELRLHQNICMSPGVVPAKYVVGVVKVDNP